MTQIRTAMAENVIEPCGLPNENGSQATSIHTPPCLRRAEFTAATAAKEAIC
ncbi:hypothetical protein RRSWK_00163 [Rhodopirellula sp. SWK7]|nr:hypothetical protein RRSWK_00163 [Rhodopirellula sp. SWK7]